jgi:hypothetical protein
MVKVFRKSRKSRKSRKTKRGLYKKNKLQTKRRTNKKQYGGDFTRDQKQELLLAINEQLDTFTQESIDKMIPQILQTDDVYKSLLEKIQMLNETHYAHELVDVINELHNFNAQNQEHLLNKIDSLFTEKMEKYENK